MNCNSVPNTCNCRTLDNRLKCSWRTVAADIWTGLPADVILQGEALDWCTIYIKKYSVLYVIDIHIVLML